jgi:phosphate uptake regulator
VFLGIRWKERSWISFTWYNPTPFTPLYILRNLVIALQKQNVLEEIGLKGISDCLSYRVVVRSIERVADHAAGIANKCLKITETIPIEVFQKIDNMSRFSLVLLNDSVEAFLRRDYNLYCTLLYKWLESHLLFQAEFSPTVSL